MLIRDSLLNCLDDAAPQRFDEHLHHERFTIAGADRGRCTDPERNHEAFESRRGPQIFGELIELLAEASRACSARTWCPSFYALAASRAIERTVT